MLFSSRISDLQDEYLPYNSGFFFKDSHSAMKLMKVMKAMKAMTLNGPQNEGNEGNEGKEFVSSIINKCICGSHKSLIFLFIIKVKEL